MSLNRPTQLIEYALILILRQLRLIQMKFFEYHSLPLKKLHHHKFI